MAVGKFYITTTLPYVNAEPHIGFALEIVQADVLARWQRLCGNEVVFNFGTDEHGQKIYQKALQLGQEPKAYCDEYASKFDNLKKALNLSYTNFIRTTDDHHIKAAQEFWKKCDANGDIYKKNYKVKYCVGCELEKTDSELVNSQCPVHPNKDLETREEENYFFRFSKYQKPLLDFYDKHPDFVVPEVRYREIKAFVKNGLEDFSISRLKSKMPWGIPVPGDQGQVMYVWFDALINYVSTLGWPDNREGFGGFWPGTQVAGKDNLRQQSAMWQAMLLSAGLPNSKQIFIHGFMTQDGQKISKSLGNTIDPRELVEKYGTDAVRYYLLAKVHPWEDSDFTEKKFVDSYNDDLAGGLGNLISRVAKLCEKLEISDFGTALYYEHNLNQIDLYYRQLREKLRKFQFGEAMNLIWGLVKRTDSELENTKPWQLEKEELYDALDIPVHNICHIAVMLQPFLPKTAEKILKQFTQKNIVSEKGLFPRILG